MLDHFLLSAAADWATKTKYTKNQFLPIDDRRDATLKIVLSGFVGVAFATFAQNLQTGFCSSSDGYNLQFSSCLRHRNFFFAAQQQCHKLNTVSTAFQVQFLAVLQLNKGSTIRFGNYQHV